MRSIYLCVGLFFAHDSEARYFSIPNQQNSTKTLFEGAYRPYFGESIKVLVWNLYKGNKESFEKAWSELSDVDLFLTQEYLDSQKMKNIVSTDMSYFPKGLEGVMGISFFLRKSAQATGVATFSRVPSIKKKAYHSHYTEPIARTPKTFLVTTYPLKNEEKLLVINFHGINFRKSRSFNNQLTKALSIVAEHKGPVIFGGDFNSWNSKRTRNLNKLTRKLGLITATFEQDDRTKFRHYPLDHLFTRGIEIIDSRVLSTKASDHNPLLIELKVKDRFEEVPCRLDCSMGSISFPQLY